MSLLASLPTFRLKELAPEDEREVIPEPARKKTPAKDLEEDVEDRLPGLLLEPPPALKRLRAGDKAPHKDG